MKRPDGALEDAVLRVLWDAEVPLPPADILDQTGLDLAYTSIATVLVRLLEKGLVRRQPRGKAFAYEAAISEGELAAQRIGAVLDQMPSRKVALAGFVQSLGKRDARLLRSLLEDQP